MMKESFSLKLIIGNYEQYDFSMNTLTEVTADDTRSSIDRKESVFLRAPIFWLIADPIPPNREVVFSAVALIADSVF
jgi:hypothetical protein